MLYNTTGTDISASYVQYGEYDIVVKIESSQPHLLHMVALEMLYQLTVVLC